MLFNSPTIQNLLSDICVDVVIGDDQKKQKDSQNIGENRQLNVGNHSRFDGIKQKSFALDKTTFMFEFHMKLNGFFL